jgi:hypothetical protein
MAKFLSKQNLEHIYNYLKTDLESINIKLDEDKKYRKAVKTMMRSIGNQQEESGKQLSVDNLNVYAVSKIKPFLVEMFKKISDNNASKNIKHFEPEGLSMSVMGYDINSSDADGNTGDELDALFKTSITNNGNVGEENMMSNSDFQKKLQEAQNSRGYSEYVINTTEFRDEVDKANKMSQKDLGSSKKNNRKMDENEFYKNLYENSENPLNSGVDFQDQTEYKEALRAGLRKDPNKNNVNNVLSSQNLLVDNQNDILKNIVVKNRDHSDDNIIEPVTSETGLENPLEIGEGASFQPILYENTQTGRERINNYIINIDSGTSATFADLNVSNLGTNFWSSFRVNIDSQLNIDKLCEIYLESMTLIGQTVPDLCPYFSIKIDEFNIATSSNNSDLRDRIVIANSADMEYTDTGVLTTGTVALGTTTAITVDGANATEFITVGDYLYTLGGQFLGIVTAVGSLTSITVGGGTKVALVENNRILVGRLKHSCNEHKLSNGYIGTLNPKRLLTFTVSIKNQDGNDVDSTEPDNNVFRDADSAQNRIMFTFLLKSVGQFSDF